MVPFVWLLTLAINIYIRSYGYEGRELRIVNRDNINRD